MQQKVKAVSQNRPESEITPEPSSYEYHPSLMGYCNLCRLRDESHLQISIKIQPGLRLRFQPKLRLPHEPGVLCKWITGDRFGG